MTTRLYYDDSYRTDFTARVEEVSADRRRVYLDRTAFYPTSGGQPFDTGTLGGSAVVEVVDEGDRIAHLLADPAPDALAAGAVVEGRIEWARRFDHMQQHSGQHLLSAVLHRHGVGTVSVHFGAETCAVDVAAESLAPELVGEVEREANAVVFENRPVTVGFESAEEASGLRRPSARTGTLRIVTMEGVDRSACGGTHVRATGEIGPILIRKVERTRGTVRLEFLCGARAVRRARADFVALSRIAQSLSTALDDAPAVVGAQTEQLRAAAGERRRLQQELAEARARELVGAATPDADGVRRVVERRPLGGGEELRALGTAVSLLPRAVLVAAVEEPPTILLAASADTGIEAGSTLRQALAAVGGRGGGTPRVAQGSVPDAAAIPALIETLLGR